MTVKGFTGDFLPFEERAVKPCGICMSCGLFFDGYQENDSEWCGIYSSACIPRSFSHCPNYFIKHFVLSREKVVSVSDIEGRL